MFPYSWIQKSIVKTETMPPDILRKNIIQALKALENLQGGHDES